VFKAGKIKREDVVLLLRNSGTQIIVPSASKPAFEASLKKLQLEYLDLYLIHTPFAFQPRRRARPEGCERQGGSMTTVVTLSDTWGALEKLVDEGKCKAIGLSDVGLEKVKEIVEAARIKRPLFMSNPIRTSRNGIS